MPLRRCWRGSEDRRQRGLCASSHVDRGVGPHPRSDAEQRIRLSLGQGCFRGGPAAWQCVGHDPSRSAWAIVADEGHRYWSAQAEGLLASLSPASSLFDQLSLKAFTHPCSPNWQDRSTQAECEQFEQAAGDGEALARITGSRAHHVRNAPPPPPSLGMAYFL